MSRLIKTFHSDTEILNRYLKMILILIQICIVFASQMTASKFPPTIRKSLSYATSKLSYKNFFSSVIVERYTFKKRRKNKFNYGIQIPC